LQIENRQKQDSKKNFQTFNVSELSKLLSNWREKVRILDCRTPKSKNLKKSGKTQGNSCETESHERKFESSNQQITNGNLRSLKNIRQTADDSKREEKAMEGE
jgi:hypothetical protein